MRVMDRVAKETGGQHIDAATTDPTTYFHQTAEELRSSYELAYYPSNPIRDNTFRKIAIRPKQTGVTVRSRTSYDQQNDPTNLLCVRARARRGRDRCFRRQRIRAPRRFDLSGRAVLKMRPTLGRAYGTEQVRSEKVTVVNRHL